MFTDSTLSEVRSRIDIVDVVSEHVSLKKAGRNFKGICPFHSENTPSFVVSPEKQIFHCFGCHEGGDIFGFVMKMEGLSFPEALEKLAEKAGVELAQKSGPRLSKEDKENFLQANRVAAWHYHETLKNSPEAEIARQYLKNRGLTDTEIETFRLGYALPHSHELEKVYQSRKVPLEAALKTGVIRSGDRGTFEGFQGRIIFPIFNRENRVVGLGGRLLENHDNMAKYINSPDSPVYDKSANLFGLPQAMEAIRKKKRIFLVEGYLDVITMHQFGFLESVAPLGTALTPRQISLMKRYSDEIIVLFDADEAGWKAAERSLDLFLQQEISPKVLILPPGEDPDTFLKKFGAKALQDKLKETRNLLAVIIDKCLIKNTKDIAGRANALTDLKPYLLQLSSSLERNLYVRKLAEGLEAPEAWIFEELGIKASAPEVKRASVAKPKQEKHGAEEMLLELFLKFESMRQKVLQNIQPAEFVNSEFQKLAGHLWGIDQVTSLSLAQLLEKVEEAKFKNLITQLSMRESPMDSLTVELVITDCILKIKRESLKLKLGDLSTQIKEAESFQQTDKVLTLLQEKQNILSALELSKNP